MKKYLLLFLAGVGGIVNVPISAAPPLLQTESRLSGNDIVVALPEDTLSRRGNDTNSAPCLRCCTYENRNYTEGAMVTMAGHLLQCQRDERSLGTNNLIWREVR
ncbi:MAG: hypothetical protein XXXJIFNMEKO3_01540 [Candidatus Erwinia impunctatus]|nr:hypothetical protein XXXJIFNMEKO_01540 [Culicoides impunctatus]